MPVLRLDACDLRLAAAFHGQVKYASHILAVFLM